MGCFEIRYGYVNMSHAIYTKEGYGEERYVFLIDCLIGYLIDSTWYDIFYMITVILAIWHNIQGQS